MTDPVRHHKRYWRVEPTPSDRPPEGLCYDEGMKGVGMPHTDSSFPLWARAVFGGVALFAAAAAVAIAAAWNPRGNAPQGLAEDVAVLSFTVLGIVLLAYGLTVKKEDGARIR